MNELEQGTFRNVTIWVKDLEGEDEDQTYRKDVEFGVYVQVGIWNTPRAMPYVLN